MDEIRIVFDVGNTTIAYALSKNSDIFLPSRLNTDSVTSAQDLISCIDDLLSESDLKPDRIVACVGVEKIRQLLIEAANHFDLEIVLLNGRRSGGVQINYDTPDTLGPDRVANAVAASYLVPLPALIIDCGTAINIDYIDSSGAFCGGAIVPGIETARDSLVEHAPSLPKVSLEVPPSIVGTNTVSCIQSGVLNGAAATIDTFIVKMKNEFDVKNVILTGGNANTIWPLLTQEVNYDEWFTLGGLALANFE